MTAAPDSMVSPQQAAVDAALLVLKSMGLSPADLAGAPSNRPPVPTFAEYVPVVAATVTKGTLRAYRPYWRKLVEQWGERPIDEPTPSEIKQLVTYVRENAIPRRNSRGGRSAGENLISALRCLYQRAGDDGLVPENFNPARKVAKPRRQASTRRALDGALVAEINHVAATTGDDPELDTLILRLHTETACRVGGALVLRPMDLDSRQCLVRLREKGETVRWQPVSPTLMAALARHAGERNAPAGGQLLRYRNGRPITDRRYDYLWDRIGRHLPWVRTQGISTHWLRPHHADVGGAQLRVRHRPRLRRPHRWQGGQGQRHVDVRARLGRRGRRCGRRADRRAPPARACGPGRGPE